MYNITKYTVENRNYFGGGWVVVGFGLGSTIYFLDSGRRNNVIDRKTQQKHNRRSSRDSVHSLPRATISVRP